MTILGHHFSDLQVGVGFAVVLFVLSQLGAWINRWLTILRNSAARVSKLTARWRVSELRRRRRMIDRMHDEPYLAVLYTIHGAMLSGIAMGSMILYSINVYAYATPQSGLDRRFVFGLGASAVLVAYLLYWMVRSIYHDLRYFEQFMEANAKQIARLEERIASR